MFQAAAGHWGWIGLSVVTGQRPKLPRELVGKAIMLRQRQNSSPIPAQDMLKMLRGTEPLLAQLHLVEQIRDSYNPNRFSPRYFSTNVHPP